MVLEPGLMIHSACLRKANQFVVFLCCFDCVLVSFSHFRILLIGLLEGLWFPFLSIGGYTSWTIPT